LSVWHLSKMFNKNFKSIYLSFKKNTKVNLK